ncbi:MAG: hypothetical protein FJX42_09460 [Alphaproteobacteria bacterium]|nr:hypothetical protein [Alphaproteobacteria bacterium]
MAKRKSTRKKYPGLLNQPMESHQTPSEILMGADKPSPENRAKNFQQFFQRLSLLFEHYGLRMGEFEKLALELARAHVPGFRYRGPDERKRGAPQKWMPHKSFELYADVNALIRQKAKREKRCSVSQACRILAETPRYAARYKGQKHKSLLRRYQEVALKIRARWSGATKQSSGGDPAAVLIDFLAMPELRGKS